MHTIIKLINLHSVSSFHCIRLLREFLTEAEANTCDKLLHNSVRCLCKGNALGCFWSGSEVRRFSKDVAKTFTWVHAGSLQLELINLHANDALREHFEATNPAALWL